MSLLIIIFLHGLLWRFIPLVDYNGWAFRVEAFSEGNLKPFQIPLFTNPDMAVVSLGALARLLGASTYGALTGSLVLLTALGISSIISVLYVLRPTFLWWLIAGVSLVFHEAYVESTPHDVITSIYIVLCYILALYLYEKRPQNHWWYVGIGVASGIVLATYLFMGILFLLPLLFFMVSFVSLRHIIAALVSSIISLLIFDSLWILMPSIHFRMMMSQTIMHAAYYIPSPLPLADFLTVAPLSLLGMLLGFSYIIAQINPPIPRKYIVFILIISLTITALLLSADYKTFRAFHPIFFLWTTFLSIFVLHLSQQLKIQKRNTPLMAGIFLIGAQLFIFLTAILKTL